MFERDLYSNTQHCKCYDIFCHRISNTGLPFPILSLLSLPIQLPAGLPFMSSSLRDSFSAQPMYPIVDDVHVCIPVHSFSSGYVSLWFRLFPSHVPPCSFCFVTWHIYTDRVENQEVTSINKTKKFYYFLTLSLMTRGFHPLSTSRPGVSSSDTRMAACRYYVIESTVQTIIQVTLGFQSNTNRTIRDFFWFRRHINRSYFPSISLNLEPPHKVNFETKTRGIRVHTLSSLDVGFFLITSVVSSWIVSLTRVSVSSRPSAELNGPSTASLRDVDWIDWARSSGLCRLRM
jgi:hypothetical protein